jgi:hypothetical protein
MRLVPLRGLDKPDILAEEPRFCMGWNRCLVLKDSVIGWSEKARSTKEGTGLKNQRGED